MFTAPGTIALLTKPPLPAASQNAFPNSPLSLLRSAGIVSSFSYLNDSAPNSRQKLIELVSGKAKVGETRLGWMDVLSMEIMRGCVFLSYHWLHSAHAHACRLCRDADLKCSTWQRYDALAHRRRLRQCIWFACLHAFCRYPPAPRYITCLITRHLCAGAGYGCAREQLDARIRIVTVWTPLRRWWRQQQVRPSQKRRRNDRYRGRPGVSSDHNVRSMVSSTAVSFFPSRHDRTTHPMDTTQRVQTRTPQVPQSPAHLYGRRKPAPRDTSQPCTLRPHLLHILLISSVSATLVRV